MDEKVRRLFVRVFKKRMSSGESFEDIADSYPNLPIRSLNLFTEGFMNSKEV